MADCPIETMLRQTRLISNQTSDKTLKKKSEHQEFVCLLKQFGATVPR